MTKKYIVTGCAGFIGSTLAGRLLSEGHEVIGVDCITDYYAEEIKRANLENLLAQDAFTFIEKNIIDINWAPLLDGADTVFSSSRSGGCPGELGRELQHLYRPQHSLDAGVA